MGATVAAAYGCHGVASALRAVTHVFTSREGLTERYLAWSTNIQSGGSSGHLKESKNEIREIRIATQNRMDRIRNILISHLALM